VVKTSVVRPQLSHKAKLQDSSLIAGGDKGHGLAVAVNDVAEVAIVGLPRAELATPQLMETTVALYRSPREASATALSNR